MTPRAQSSPKAENQPISAPASGPKSKPPTEAAKRKTVEALRSRIVGHEDVAPSLLKANPLNFRKHGASQVAALSGSLGDLGWVKSILVSKRTNTIIDGHARLEYALAKHLPSVPVEWIDLDANEERKALALLDPITEMATRDEGLFMNLLYSIKTESDEVNEVLKKLSPVKRETEEESKTQTTTDVMAYNPNVFFPSSNKWGIPDIDPAMLYDGDAPLTTYPAEDLKGAPQFYVYGANGHDERVTGRILTFYTEDWRFERIWGESVESLRTIVPLKPAGFTSPDFSLWGDDPLVVQMWNIYRARWITRYWQAVGLKCIPSLATSTNPACYEFAYDGFPARPSLMSMQMRTGGLKSRQQINSVVTEVATLIERVNPMRLVIYGQNNQSKMASLLPGGIEYIWADDFTNASFGKLQAKRIAKKQAELMGGAK